MKRRRNNDNSSPPNNPDHQQIEAEAEAEASSMMNSQQRRSVVDDSSNTINQPNLPQQQMLQQQEWLSQLIRSSFPPQGGQQPQQEMMREDTRIVSIPGWSTLQNAMIQPNSVIPGTLNNMTSGMQAEHQFWSEPTTVYKHTTRSTRWDVFCVAFTVNNTCQQRVSESYTTTTTTNGWKDGDSRYRRNERFISNAGGSISNISPSCIRSSRYESDISSQTPYDAFRFSIYQLHTMVTSRKSLEDNQT